MDGVHAPPPGERGRPYRQEPPLTDIFDHLPILAEPTRARLLRVLEREELGVGELARVVQLPQSTVSRHLKALHEAGWASRRREGTASLFQAADPRPAAGAAVWPAIRQATRERWGEEDDLRVEAVLASRADDGAGFFGRVAGRWEEVRRELYGEAFLVPVVTALLPGGATLLDLGVGTGTMAAELAPGVGRVIGVDREQAMLDAAARRCAGLDNVELLRASLDDLPLESDRADIALALLVLHLQAQVGPVLAEARRVVRPGGRLVVLDMMEHDREAYRQAMGHQHLGFDPGRLAEQVRRAGFPEVRCRPLPADPDAKGPPLFVLAAGG
jgi:SAM-dependent methyltransferase